MNTCMTSVQIVHVNRDENQHSPSNHGIGPLNSKPWHRCTQHQTMASVHSTSNHGIGSLNTKPWHRCTQHRTMASVHSTSNHGIGSITRVTVYRRAVLHPRITDILFFLPMSLTALTTACAIGAETNSSFIYLYRSTYVWRRGDVTLQPINEERQWECVLAGSCIYYSYESG